MQLGVIGLGRMGGNIVRRLTRNGHDCVVFDQNPSAIDAIAGKGVTGAADLKDLARLLKAPRAAWVMLPAGEITEKAVEQLGDLLAAGDTIIDGGNAFYKDDIRRAKALKSKGIDYIDCGTSGGVWGLERGYSLMIGGAKDAVDRLDPIFSALAPGTRRNSGHPRSGRPRSACRTWLHALWPERRRALRQDGPQRNRVRPHAGLRGGVQYPAWCGLGKAYPRNSVSSSISPTLPRSGAAAAS